MQTVRLGFKAFDIHELLCHCVALEAGLYAAEGLSVALLDTTFIPEEPLDPELPQVACGAALAAWLRGARMKVLFVATDRPMFWLYGREPLANLVELRGRDIAGYPAIAPPAQLLSVILARSGVDPGRDVTVRAARDDVARIGLLGTGDVAAAVVSSSVPPAEMERLGFHVLAFFGDAIRVPTTGLAVTASFLERNPRAARGLTTALRAALERIHTDTNLVRTVLARHFRIAAPAQDATIALVRRCYTTDGATSAAIAQGAVDAMASALSIAPVPPAAGLYATLRS
jgi:ABC-type nitrate/sulfonate/bicarbonate transport system substrate-binding protein